MATDKNAATAAVLRLCHTSTLSECTISVAKDEATHNDMRRDARLKFQFLNTRVRYMQRRHMYMSAVILKRWFAHTLELERTSMALNVPSVPLCGVYIGLRF
jgi:hypothetical protein